MATFAGDRLRKSRWVALISVWGLLPMGRCLTMRPFRVPAMRQQDSADDLASVAGFCDSGASEGGDLRRRFNRHRKRRHRSATNLLIF